MKAYARYILKCQATGQDPLAVEKVALSDPRIPLIPKRKKDGGALNTRDTGIYYNWLIEQMDRLGGGG